jgi:leucine dehydrogenase
MKACLEQLGKPVDFAGLTVAVQGVGATGFRLAKLCRDAGATVIVSDTNAANLQRAVKELGCTAHQGDILSAKCDILAPCALGAVLDDCTIPALQCQVICGTANNQLADPIADGARLKQAGVVYGPDFVVNAAGLIRLAGLYLGMTEDQINRKIADIEATTLTVLRDACNLPSAHEAAVAYAKRRIEQGRTNRPRLATAR